VRKLRAGEILIFYWASGWSEYKFHYPPITREASRKFKKSKSSFKIIYNIFSEK
jgi:hypothetical protein